VLGPETPGFRLVADDVVQVEIDRDLPKALAPARHAGLIEVRGMGIVRVPHVASASIVLAVALLPWKQIERYPPPRRKEMIIAGLSVPLIDIDATSPSAALRVGLALALQDEPGRLYGYHP
jgi:serine kinase of HPr protein (carbohydrate metabolism regulator)